MTNDKTPTHMRAFGIFKAEGLETSYGFVERSVPLPKIGPMDLLVEIEAIAMNPADYRTRQRKSDDGKFSILGWDAAGIVREAGSDVTDFAIGDPVYYAGDLTRPGSNSAFQAIDSRLVSIRPTRLSAEEAAALPLTALTAWEALFEHLAIGGETVAEPATLLIVGGAGGVGSIAVQLAARLENVTVVATASREESRNWCLDLGADHVVNHHEDMGRQWQDLGLPAPTALFLTNAPDAHWDSICGLIAPQGRICNIVPFAEPVDLNPLMRKSAAFAWEFMFTRSMFATHDMSRQGEILKKVSRLVDAGEIRTTANRSLGPVSPESLSAAHHELETGSAIGKITMTFNSEKEG